MSRLLLLAALLFVGTPGWTATVESVDEVTVVARAEVAAETPQQHGEEGSDEQGADEHADDHGSHGYSCDDPSHDHNPQNPNYEAYKKKAPYTTEKVGYFSCGYPRYAESYDMLPHVFKVLRYTVFADSYEFYKYSKMFEAPFFAFLAALFLILVARRLYQNRSELPGRLQAFFEIMVEQILNVTTTMMGEQYGRKYAPFVATIFLYLLVQNYSGIIPLGKAPSAVFLNNFSIALCVFLYVQYTGFKRLGVGGYLHHLCGSPNNAVAWMLAPLMFVLELIGEFAKPISLSLRLFGNIFGKDMLLAVFALLGVVSLSMLPTDGWIGLPLHLPFFFLALLLGLIQAVVFALLTTVYISMMLPHDHDHEPGHEEEAHA